MPFRRRGSKRTYALRRRFRRAGRRSRVSFGGRKRRRKTYGGGFRKIRPSGNARLIFQRLPNRQRVKLKYIESSTYDPGAGGFAINQWGLNRPRDPNITGIGHSPLGWVEWSTRYLNYVTLSATYKFIHIGSNVVGADDPTVTMFARVGTDIAFSANPNTVDETSGFQKKMITHNSRRATMAPSRVISGRVGIKQWFPQSWFTRSTTVSLDPGDELYLTTGYYPSNFTSNPGQQSAKVEIVYDILFFGRIDPTIGG